LNITSLELEDPQYLAYEAPLSVRKQRLKAAQTDNMAGERAGGKEGGRGGDGGYVTLCRTAHYWYA
jgi:hypothetical protein